MDYYVNRLKQNKSSLIVLKEGKIIFESSADGIRPLFDAEKNVGLANLEDSIIVDKIVGKAAALIVSYFKVKEVHCEMLSHRGKIILDKMVRLYSTENLIPEVLNKAGTDICPFEREVLDIDNPEEAYNQLYKKLESLMGRST